MTNRNILVLSAIAISIAATMWGLDGVVLTPRLSNLDVSFVVFILHAFPFLLMHSFLYGEYKNLRLFSARDFLLISIVALLGGAIGTIAIVKALFLVNFKELSIVVLLQKLQPVFAITLAAIILKEKVSKYFLVWASVAVMGGYFLTFGFKAPNLGTGSNTPLAALYALLAAFSFGSSTVFSKMILQKFDYKTATFFRYGFTSVIMFLIVMFAGKFAQFNQVTPGNIIIFTIIAFTTGSGAIFLFYFGLKHLKAIVAIICELFFPISTIVFDYIFNGNRLTAVQWLSAAVMIFAIINLNDSQTREISAEA